MAISIVFLLLNLYFSSYSATNTVLFSCEGKQCVIDGSLYRTNSYFVPRTVFEMVEKLFVERWDSSIILNVHDLPSLTDVYIEDETIFKDCQQIKDSRQTINVWSAQNTHVTCSNESTVTSSSTGSTRTASSARSRTTSTVPSTGSTRTASSARSPTTSTVPSTGSTRTYIDARSPTTVPSTGSTRTYIDAKSPTTEPSTGSTSAPTSALFSASTFFSTMVPLAVATIAALILAVILIVLYRQGRINLRRLQFMGLRADFTPSTPLRRTSSLPSLTLSSVVSSAPQSSTVQSSTPQSSAMLLTTPHQYPTRWSLRQTRLH